MAKNLLSINDLSKKEILDLIEFANNFFNEEGDFRRESLFPDKTIANVCEQCKGVGLVRLIKVDGTPYKSMNKCKNCGGEGKL